MTTYALERQYIESRFATNWSTRTPVAYEGVKYIPTAGTSYVRLLVVDGKASRTNIGPTGLYRHSGIINIQIYTPNNIGTATARGHADTALGIFRGQYFNGITCLDGWVTSMGEIDGWLCYVVSINFFWDA